MRPNKDTKVREGQGNRSAEADRDELLRKAETLGLDELGWIHGGGESAFYCCGWGTVGNCNRQGCGRP